MEKYARKSSARSLRKILSVILAVSMILTTNTFLFAADSVLPDDYRGLKSAQPDLKGYRIQEIATWSPETDPFAEYLKADVPLQKRIDAYKPTQANPGLDSDAKIMLMQGDYGNAFFESPVYNNDFSNLCFNFWQYTDYFSPWHGATTYGTPEGFYDNPKTSWWTSRGFEFGIINIPIAAYTNAAHKNGVMSIAGIYFDPTGRPGQTCKDLFERDAQNGFPVAKKMVEMAEYYGFDGYFFNNEESSGSEFQSFMKVIKDAGLYVQYYNTGNSFTGKSSYLGPDPSKPIYSDSVFVNYGWPGSNLNSDKSWFNSNPDVNPYEVAFYGAENNQAKFSGGHSSANIPALYKAGTKNPVASIALFTPSDYYHRSLTDDLGWSGAWNGDSPNQNPGYQWMIAERERMFFSGVYCDPTDTGSKKGYSRPDVGIQNASSWVGVADFTSERSVIGGSVFYTNFNTGHGMQYFKNGAVSNDEEWTNLSVQDILPTWQWWIESEGANKLSADFDYGKKEVRKDKDFKTATLPYNQVGAYDGGSSLVLYGDVNAKNTMHLYKTDLAVNSASEAEITFKKTSSGNAGLKLGFTVKDTNEYFEIDVPDSATAGEWTTRTVSLDKLAGKKIAAVSLVVDGSESKYQMNVGGLRILDGASHTPSAPTGLKITNAYSDGQMELVWTLGNYNTVKQYNVYGKFSDGTTRCLGGIFGDNYYIKNLYGEDKAVTIEVRAVGADGTESAPASVTYTYNDKVSGLTVPQGQQANPTNAKSIVYGNAEEGVVDAHWTAPATGDFDHYELQVDFKFYGKEYDGTQTYTATADKASTSFKVPVPVYEGYDYTLSVCTVGADGTKGEPICFTSKLKDKYCEPMKIEDMSYSGSTLSFKTPKPKDWYRIHVSVNGIEQSTRQRATNTARSGYTINSGSTVNVWLEDYAGNMSAPTAFQIIGGQIVPLDGVTVSVEPKTASVKIGTTKQFTATVVGNDITDSTVKWTVEGNKSTKTKIDANGLLTVGSDETAAALTVKATSNEDSEAYDTAAVAVSDGTIVENLALHATVLGATTTSDQNPAETPKYAIDGDVTTKWCPGGNALKAWMAIDLGGTKTVTQWVQQNTGANKAPGSDGSGRNTVDYELQMLDTSKITEEELFALSGTALENALKNDGNWITLKGYTGNRLDETAYDFIPPINGRIFRLNVTKGDNSTMWPSTRIQEWQMFGYDYIEETSNVTITPDSATVEQGASQQFTADLKDGDETAEFKWEVEGATSADTTIDANGLLTVGADETATSLTVKAIAKDDDAKSATVTVTVTAKSYPITIGTIENGTVEADKASAAVGETVTLTVTPDEGYKLVSVSVNGTAITGNTFEMPAENVVITAVFAEIPVADKGVTVTPDTAEVEQGAKQQFTAAYKETVATGDLESIIAEAEYDSSTGIKIDGEDYLKMLTGNADDHAEASPAGSWDYGSVNDVSTITFKFDEAKTISAWAGACGHNNEGAQFGSISCKMYYSTDEGKTWIEMGSISNMVAEFNDATVEEGTYIIQELNAPITAQYFKYEINKWQEKGGKVDYKAAWGCNLYASSSETTDIPAEFDWEVLGVTSAKTTIDENGLLTVGADETATSLTVKATVKDDETKFGTASVVVIKKEAEKFAITVGATTNGTASADKAEAAEGETVTVTATPNTGYELDSIKVNGTAITGNTFEMPAEDVTVTVTFKAIKYQVTVGTPTNGTASADKAEAAEGETVTITATPNTGYELDSIKVNGTAITGNTFEMPAEDVTVTVTFKAIKYQVTVGTPTNGTASADKAEAAEGETVTITATPNAGYELDSIKVNGTTITGNTFEMPAEDVTVTVTFKAIKYQVTVGTPTNGTASADKAEAAEGEAVTITATPNAGYELDSIKVNGTAITGNTFPMPANNVTVTVTFKKSAELYDITVKVTGKGEVKLDKEKAAEGETVTVTATPEAGYRFSYIKVDNKIYRGTPEFTMPAHNVTLTVVFTKISTGGGSSSTTPSQPTPDYEIEVIYPEVVTPEAPGTTNPPTGDSFGGLALMLALAGGAMVVLKKRHDDEK